MQILEERKHQVFRKGSDRFEMECNKRSLAGAVSQRACVFCGLRVILYPIADAIHLVHGPIGCAAYTWDIRGSLSSGPELHRLSFSTDLSELDIIQGGETKLRRALRELIARYQPQAAFVYATCIVGLIGDDVAAVCAQISRETGIPVIAVESEGFKGTKKDGYRAACEALLKLIGTGTETADPGRSSNGCEYTLNILGDFNLAGEVWLISDYYRRMGIEVVATLTGDGRIDRIRAANRARLNLVQCAGSMIYLAQRMEELYGIPYQRVSYFGIEDMAESLYNAARFFGGSELLARTRELVREEIGAVYPRLLEYRKDLNGKKAAIYVGGGFKAFSLVKALRLLGMKTVLVGTQTGTTEDYRQLRDLCDPDTVIVDDSNPLELAEFLTESDVDLFIGGVKERPIAYKLGIGFCDHNHERKEALAGFSGMVNFAREVHSSVMSPVWRLAPRRNRRSREESNG